MPVYSAHSFLHKIIFSLHKRFHCPTAAFSVTPWIVMRLSNPSLLRKNHYLINYMLGANPVKFQFMLFSPTHTEQQVLQLHVCNGMSLTSEAEVTVLGVTMDNKLCFSQHTSVCCNKAARQLHALVRISKYLNVNSRRPIYNSPTLSNVNYFLLE